MSITRRDLVRGGLALGLAPSLFACSEVPAGEPVAIVYDRDLCAHCAMMISERKFAAEAYVPETRKMLKFDDVGCMAAHAVEKGFVDDPAARLWVMNAEDATTWLDARTASYDDGAHSPMGYGYLARPAGKGRLGFTNVKTTAASRAHCETPSRG